jgi:hypothetical protein
MSETKTRKLYCYVDETGQDTKGNFFIVVAVVIDDERDQLNRHLQEVERSSGIGKKKWVRAKRVSGSRNEYLMSAASGELNSKVFYRTYARTGTGAFEHLTVLAVAQAVSQYRDLNKVGDNYRVSIMIDGLKPAEEARVGKSLRQLGIHSRKVRGGRDESEPILQLADRIAGLVRGSHEGQQEYELMQKQLERRGVLKRLS